MTTKEAFDKIPEKDFDELICLSMSPADDEGAVTMVFSSKRLLLNAWNSHRVQNTEGIVLSADFKWRLTRNGWPLGVLGTDLALGDDKMVHSMIPFIFAWSTAESDESFRFLLDSFTSTLKTFFEIENLNVVAATIDHSSSLR